MRLTFASPQLCAMSVAFDDQGDTVPRRGTTSSAPPERDRGAPGAVRRRPRPVVKQALQHVDLVRRQLALDVDEVIERGVQRRGYRGSRAGSASASSAAEPS